jgi:PAS domain S-box-containing protein
MNKESESKEDIENLVDQLFGRKANGSIFHTESQIEEPDTQYSQTLVHIDSPENRHNKQNNEARQNSSDDNKSGISTDLTEKYRLIALNTSDLIAFTTFDANPTFTFISPSHKKILGYAEDDLLGKPGLNFIHEDDVQNLLTILLMYFDAKNTNALTSEMVNSIQKLDFRFRDKSGQWHFLRSTVDIVKNELLFISKDITEQKKAQEALIESERKYRSLYDNLRDGFAAVDLNGKITECNAAFVGLLRYSIDELHKLTYVDLTPAKWHDFERTILSEQVKERGYSDLYEKEYIRKDGTIFPVELQTYILSDDKNQPCGYWAFIRDITLRKKMDLEQKENQEQIKAIVMNAPIGIAVVGSKAKFISANDAFCKILGYSESELKTMSYKDITHPDELDESSRLVEDLKAGNISYFSLEKRYLKKDKSVIFGKVTVSIIRDKHDTPSLYIAELEDITLRKQMDEALKESEEKFVKAFKSSPIALCITRISDGKFIEANESLIKLSGYSQSELLTGSSIGFNLWANSEDRKRVVEQLKTNGSVHDQEYRFRIKNGNEIYVRYSGELIDFSGELCVLSVLVDITKQTKIEQSLKESEEKYRSIIENTKDVILLTAPDGRISYISPACFDMTGYNPDELIGILPEIFYPADREKIQSELSNALKGNSGSNLEYRIITKNKEVRWISHSWSPILTEENKLKFVVSIIRNITESKISEQNLKLKIEELEQYKNVTVNREIKMIVLKNEVNELRKQLKQEPKYPTN